MPVHRASFHFFWLFAIAIKCEREEDEGGEQQKELVPAPANAVHPTTSLSLVCPRREGKDAARKIVAAKRSNHDSAVKHSYLP
jgi:hypothetical protein